MRDARINPVAGDVLAIGISQWEVAHVFTNFGTHDVKVRRMGSESTMTIGRFRCFFKSASTVKLGDQK